VGFDKITENAYVCLLEAIMEYDPIRYPVVLVDRRDVSSVLRFINEEGGDLLQSGAVGDLEKGLVLRLFGSDCRIYHIVDKQTRVVVAAGNVAYYPSWRGLVGMVDHVLVHKHHRRRGLARAMMLKMIVDACPRRDPRVYKLRLTCEPHRIGARLLYRSLGFTLEKGSDTNFELKLNSQTSL
jgi:GNAT superfamily N-acetyltransferase